MAKYTEKLMKDFQAYLQTLTDQPVTLFDAEESMDNLINLYLCLADIEKAHRPELEALKKAREQALNSSNMQQNTSEKQQNSRENPE